MHYSSFSVHLRLRLRRTQCYTAQLLGKLRQLQDILALRTSNQSAQPRLLGNKFLTLSSLFFYQPCACPECMWRFAQAERTHRETGLCMMHAIRWALPTFIFLHRLLSSYISPTLVLSARGGSRKPSARCCACAQNVPKLAHIQP